MYRLQRHIYDASRRYYLPGRDRLIASLDVAPGGTVLEAGCGTGRNLIKAALLYPEARLYGFDISDEMLKAARASIARRGLTDRIQIAQGDALDFDPLKAFGIEAFDRIYFSYALSMIPRWQMALQHAGSMLAQKGSLHAADFGQFEALPGLVRKMMFAWLRQFHVAPRAELHSEFAALAAARGGQATFEPRHGGYDWYAGFRASR